MPDPLNRLARAIWARLRSPRHKHDWKPMHTLDSGWTPYRCTGCWKKTIG